MTVLLAVLICGVLLDSKDLPMPNYDLAFTDANGKLIEVMTDKDGKFSVAPGTYRVQFGLPGYYPPLEKVEYYPPLDKAETITVNENTSELKLHKPPVIIEVIRGTQRALPLGPRG